MPGKGFGKITKNLRSETRRDYLLGPDESLKYGPQTAVNDEPARMYLPWRLGHPNPLKQAAIGSYKAVLRRILLALMDCSS
jgi:hypothetical protein